MAGSNVCMLFEISRQQLFVLFRISFAKQELIHGWFECLHAF